MTRPDLSGGTIGGHFKLSKRLGSGYFGDVYLCQNTLVGRESALKVVGVKAADKDALALEAKLLNLTAHDHIVRVRSAAYWQDTETHDHLLIEMEYLPGGSLEDAIAREVSLGQLVAIMKNVLFALDHAHPDVIHRDVKPANILLGGGGKLSDFGIAMVAATGARASNLQYNLNLAPECFPPTSEFNVATDVFAAGLAFLRALNLIVDWRGVIRSIPDARGKMTAGTFVKALGTHPRVPSPFKKIVTRACAKQPSKRYASAAAFRDALEALKILRDWQRCDPDTWRCEYDGGQEELLICEKRGAFQIDYTRKGRRKASYHREGLSRADAERAIYEIIAQTTLS